MRTEIVKRVAKDLVNRFPKRFGKDFDSNKRAVETLTDISSRKLRNRVAGYITHITSLTQSSEESSE